MERQFGRKSSQHSILDQDLRFIIRIAQHTHVLTLISTLSCFICHQALQRHSRLPAATKSFKVSRFFIYPRLDSRICFSSSAFTLCHPEGWLVE
jgi:hypothetical protein